METADRARNSPIETPEAMQYYSYLLKAKEIDSVLMLEKGGSFPVSFDRKSFVPGLNKVLARSCTKHLYEIFLWIIDEKPVDGALHKGIIVTGPPGDGKSFASQLFLCYLLRVEKEKRVHVVYEDVFSNRVWVFRSDGICRHFTGPAHHDNCPELDNPSTVFSFDVNADIKPGSGSREPVGCKAWLAVFSSANNDALKATSRLGMLPLSFVTPDYEDLHAAQVALGAEFDVAAQFNKFGGRLRWPFDFTSQGINYYVAKAVENLNLNKLSSLLLNNYTIGFGDTAPTTLFSTVLDPERQLTLNQSEANPLSDKTAQAAKHMQLLVDLYRASNVIWMVSSDHIFDKILNKEGENKESVLGILDNATKRTKFGG